MVWVETELWKWKISVGCAYRPPDERAEFWSPLDGSLETLQGRDNVLMGELNVDAFNKGDPHFRHLKSLQLSLQLHNVIQSPTRLTVTSAKCRDVILSNHSAFSDGYVEHLPFTDHALVYSISNTEELSDNLGPCFISRRHWSSLTIRKNNWKTLFFVLLRNGKLLGWTKCGRNGKITFCQLLIRLPR